MKIYIMLFVLLFSSIEALCCDQSSREYGRSETFYQLCQLSVFIKYNSSEAYKKEAIEAKLISFNILSLSDSIDKIFEDFSPDNPICEPLFESKAKELFKTACELELKAQRENRVIFWRFHVERNKEPEFISYSRGLLSGYIEDGQAYYRVFGSNISACTYIYFASLENAITLYNNGIVGLFDVLKETFPEHFSNSPELFFDNSDEESAEDILLKIIQEISVRSMEYNNKAQTFYSSIYQPYFSCTGDKRSKVQQGSLAVLSIPVQNINKLEMALDQRRCTLGYKADRVLFGRGEDFHAKIPFDLDTKLTDADWGAEKILVYKDGSFIK